MDDRELTDLDRAAIAAARRGRAAAASASAAPTAIVSYLTSLFGQFKEVIFYSFAFKVL